VDWSLLTHCEWVTVEAVGSADPPAGRVARGFSPEAAARHSQSARVYTEFFSYHFVFFWLFSRHPGTHPGKHPGTHPNTHLGTLYLR